MCSAFIAHPCVNIWSTSSTNSNTFQRNTWWTVYWRTSPFCRCVSLLWMYQWVSLSVTAYTKFWLVLLSHVMSLLCSPPGGVQQRNPGDTALYRLCVWSLHKWTRCTVSCLSTSEWLASCCMLAETLQRLFDALQHKHYFKHGISATLNKSHTHTFLCRPTVHLQSHLFLVFRQHYSSQTLALHVAFLPLRKRLLDAMWCVWDRSVFTIFFSSSQEMSLNNNHLSFLNFKHLFIYRTGVTDVRRVWILCCWTLTIQCWCNVTMPQQLFL